MHKFIVSVLVVGVAIIATGIFLDEAGKGTLGGFVKDLAKKSTSGFGSLNA